MTTDETPQYRPLKAIELISLANGDKKVRATLNQWIADRRADTDLTGQDLLRIAVMILHMIGSTVPHDDETGLDATRFYMPVQTIIPPFREVIEVFMGMKFLNTEAPTDGDEETREWAETGDTRDSRDEDGGV